MTSKRRSLSNQFVLYFHLLHGWRSSFVVQELLFLSFHDRLLLKEAMHCALEVEGKPERDCEVLLAADFLQMTELKEVWNSVRENFHYNV